MFPAQSIQVRTYQYSTKEVYYGWWFHGNARLSGPAALLLALSVRLHDMHDEHEYHLLRVLPNVGKMIIWRGTPCYGPFSNATHTKKGLPPSLRSANLDKAN